MTRVLIIPDDISICFLWNQSIYQRAITGPRKSETIKSGWQHQLVCHSSDNPFIRGCIKNDIPIAKVI